MSAIDVLTEKSWDMGLDVEKQGDFDSEKELAFDCYEAWFKINNVEKSIFMQGIEALREFAGVDGMAGDDIDYIEKKIKRCEGDYEVLFEN